MASVGAFALACNVFQAALWCYEAGHAVYQIYKDGTSPANRSLEDLTQHLTTALARLNDIKNAASPTEHDKKLKEVADMCLRIGNDLQGKLTKMTNSSTDGKRERLQKAVRAVWEKESIQELHNSLRDVQQVLNTVGMIHTVNTSRRNLALSTEQSQKLKQLSDDCHSSFDNFQGAFDDLRQEITDLKGLVNDEGIKTRGLMNDKAAAAEWRAAYERLLASVAFGAMNARSNSSSLECHEGTFEHILLEKATGRPDAPWDCFNTWLRTGSGIYWISGKPGSGKSTLMKFLTDHAGTMKGLRTWASRKEIRILKHFFWSAGNELEKDPKGFLLTMLHQAWTKDEVVAITLLQQHDHWKEKRTPSDWSVKHLREALKTTFHATRCSYCIFVDGLDECNSRGTESQDALLDYIQALGQELNIKFCVSSRPETIFNHRLYKHPKLRLQDLNKSDVELFVDEAFCGRLTAEPGRVISNEQERDLRADLIDSSNGVFLWVRLAVKTVLDGIRNGDDWEDLRARLNQTAGSLEALYKDMWDRLNEDKKLYRSEAALIFNHMIALGNQPSVLEVMLLLDEELRRKHLEAGIIPSNSDLAQKCQLVERRIPVRCAGLLEVLRCWDLEEYPDPPRTRIRTPDQLAELSTFYSTHITFIHRTAGDFLMGTEAGHQIQSHHPLTDAESCSVAVQAEIVAFRAGIFELAPELVVRFLCDARVEKVGAHNVALLEAIDMACALRIGQSDDGNNTKNWVTSMTITDA